MHPVPLILPSPVRSGGQRQIKPSGELTQVAFSTQSEIDEHSSRKQPFPLICPSPMNPNGQRQTKPSGELTQVAFSTQSEIDEHSSAVIKFDICIYHCKTERVTLTHLRLPELHS